MGYANPDFDLFQLPEEHVALREAIRALALKEIEPYAADVDERSRFPEEALKALTASGFNAIHVPEQYGGQGADSVAACIVIEEVARVDASSSLIPAVNKLGTMGLILNGSEELKQQVLPSIASGEAMASYALSEREAGSDAAAMKTRRQRVWPHRLAATPASTPAASASPSGAPRRPSGIWLSSAAFWASGSTSVMSVAMKPGAMQLTVIPREPTSWASDLEKPIMPALDAE